MSGKTLDADNPHINPGDHSALLSIYPKCRHEG